MTEIEIAIVPKENVLYEYYCKSCRSLRLYARTDGKPTVCGNCNSHDIEVDVVGSDRLWKLRHPEESL